MPRVPTYDCRTCPDEEMYFAAPGVDADGEEDAPGLLFGGGGPRGGSGDGMLAGVVTVGPVGLGFIGVMQVLRVGSPDLRRGLEGNGM